MKSTIIDYTADARHTLEKDVLPRLEAGQRVILSLDGVHALEVDDLRRLVSLLRRSRAIGGELLLQTSKPAVRRVLAVTALDRVFTVLAPEAA